MKMIFLLILADLLVGLLLLVCRESRHQGEDVTLAEAPVQLFPEVGNMGLFGICDDLARLDVADAVGGGGSAGEVS